MRSRSDVLAGPAERTKPERPEQGATATSSAEDALRGRIILVADAHPDTRELYRVFLQSAGARIIDAQDGRDALVKACSDHPDAIVSDAQLPFIDGLELCRLLRTDGRNRRSADHSGRGGRPVHGDRGVAARRRRCRLRQAALAGHAAQ